MKWFFKLSKKDKITRIVIVVGAIILIVFLYVLLSRIRKSASPDESIADGQEYMLYLDVGTDFRYTYSMEFPRSTAEDGRIVFTIPQGETAVFTIVPSDGKLIKDITVKAGTEKIEYERVDNDISFTMPAHSVSVSPVTETDPSYATPTPGPQKVTVEGVTQELADLMQGQYDEKLFLSNLRTALALDNTNSSFRDVEVISFTGETVNLGIDNTVGMVAILNHTTTRKVLVSYNTASNVYSFTLNYVPTLSATSTGVTAPPATATPRPTATPLPKPTTTQVPAANGNTGSGGSAFGSGGAGGGYGNGGYGNGSYDNPSPEENETPTVEEFISRFSLYDYPESFSSYVGGSDAFFSALFDYVYAMDPTITSGTFEGFNIDGNFIKFSVSLSNGGILVGTYDRDAGEFYF